MANVCKSMIFKIALLSAAVALSCIPVAASSMPAGVQVIFSYNTSILQVNDTLDAYAELPLPAVPADMREPRERASFIMAHFWDAMDFNDTVRSRDDGFMEQNLVNFMSLMPHAGKTGTAQATARLLQRAAADTITLSIIIDTAGKYLYSPDSPLRDEDSYIVFLETLTSLSCIPSILLMRPAIQLEEVRKNSRGSVAADFAYFDKNGDVQTLHGTAAPKMLLMFYDPDCDSCNETIEQLRNDEYISSEVSSGRLTILAVSLSDDRAGWETSLSSMPSNWLSGIAHDDIVGCGRYVLQQLPALYLLDADKTVKIKEYDWRAVKQPF